MEVFISWSGGDSERLAQLLRGWLPQVVNQLTPWMSTEDIRKGKLWNQELMKTLDRADQGIICVTVANQNSPWLNFEAGALAKSIGIASVRPLLLNLTKSQLHGPLTSFQATLANDRKDMLRLMHSLNGECDPPISNALLDNTFANAWESFAGQLRQILVEAEVERPPPPREIDDMLDEILVRVRRIDLTIKPTPANPDADAFPRIDLGG